MDKALKNEQSTTFLKCPISLTTQQNNTKKHYLHIVLFGAMFNTPNKLI